MFKCPSRLKQRGATCLIQSRCNLCVVCFCIGWKQQLVYPLLTLTSQSCPLPLTQSSRSTLSCVESCEAPAGSLLCMIAGRGNVTWVLCFWGNSLSSSHRANATLVSLEPDEQNFTSSRGKLLSTTRNHPLHGIRCHCPLYPIYHQVWPAHLHFGDLTRDERKLGCEHVCLCECVWQNGAGGELGNPISHTEEQRQAGRYAPGPE